MVTKTMTGKKPRLRIVAVATWALMGVLAVPGNASDRAVKSKIPPIYRRLPSG